MSELQTTRTLDMIAGEIRTFTASMLNNVIEIGRRLVEAKELVPYGQFGDWVRANTGYSSSAANNFMRLYQEYGAAQGSLFGTEADCQTYGNLSVSKALALLALPSGEREEFVAEHDVDAMSTRELQAAIKAREEAEANARVAEASRAKMEEDMAVAKGLLEAARAEATAAEAAQKEAEEKAARLAAELKELESRPVDVAVEAADPAELEKARAEGRAEQEEQVAALKRELDEAKAAKEEAAKAKAAAEAASKDAEESMTAIQQQSAASIQREREEVERLRKELAAAGNKALAEFGVRFETVQKDFNALLECLEKLKEDGESYGKMVTATRKLLEAVEKRVPEGAAAGDSLPADRWPRSERRGGR